MKSIGIGIIGCGFRARMIALQVIEKCPQTSVVALCDPSERSLAMTKKSLVSVIVIELLRSGSVGLIKKVSPFF